MKIDINEVAILGEYSSAEWGFDSDEVEYVLVSKMVIDYNGVDGEVKKILTIIADVDGENVLNMFVSDWDKYEEDEINRIIKK